MKMSSTIYGDRAGLAGVQRRIPEKLETGRQTIDMEEACNVSRHRDIALMIKRLDLTS